MKNKMLIIMIVLSMVTICGCQKTPDKSAVVSKAGGLSKAVVNKPLKDGQTRAVDIPEHWQATEKRSNDRATITADLSMDSVKVGNLPVLEMKNHVMTQGELEELVDYFAGDEQLYVPQLDTKEVYQKTKDRIDNRAGEFANAFMQVNYKEQAKALIKAIELAPEKHPDSEQAEVEFGKKIENEAKDTADNWSGAGAENSSEKTDKELYFSAETGADRQALLKAEKYNEDAGNTSCFSWETGGGVIDLSGVQEYRKWNKVGDDFSGYAEKWDEVLDTYETAMNQESISEEEGKKQVEQVLKELDIQDMVLLSEEQMVWFPKEAFPKIVATAVQDSMWQADLEKAESGYVYTFTRTAGGLPIDQMDGIVMKESKDSYAPPFPTEKITVSVTGTGIKKFSWKGMCENVSTVAENTEILPFQEIQKKLFEQIFYFYAGMGQPPESKANFIFKVIDAKLVYTYVPAYNNPEHSWLVPAWIFQVMENTEDEEELGELGKEKEMRLLPFVVNALDGGMIGTPSGS